MLSLIINIKFCAAKLIIFYVNSKFLLTKTLIGMKKEDFQEFFKYRMAEIMHKDTLDSYRVRANNAHTILRELSYVLEG